MAHIVPEGDVVGVEIIAVGPLHAFAQMEGPDSVVIIILVALDDVGIIAAVGVAADDGFQRGAGEIPGAAAAYQIDGAAVGADRKLSAGGILRGDENVIRDGQTILNLAVSSQRSNGGCFGVGCGSLCCKGRRGQNQHQSQKQSGEFLHCCIPPNVCLPFRKRFLRHRHTDEMNRRMVKFV